jgi:uncharacterized protein YfaP (DUF2135 family)
MKTTVTLITRRVAIALSLGLLWACAASAQQPAAPPSSTDTPGVQRPIGGWFHSGLQQDAGTVHYAYPPNLIDRGGQRGRTMIEGRLKREGQQRKAGSSGPARTPTLVVNGNAMPLQTDDQGRFARPYAFGAGSNSIEVRDENGSVVQRTQFIEAASLKTQARVRVILSWDDPKAELDLHVLTPDGGHAFWASPVLTNGGGLDVDSVDGAGPEMFSMTAPMGGAYHVYVNYWGRFDGGGYNFDDEARQQPIITARIGLVFDENTPGERRETFSVPMRKIGDLTLVRSFLR